MIKGLMKKNKIESEEEIANEVSRTKDVSQWKLRRDLGLI